MKIIRFINNFCRVAVVTLVIVRIAYKQEIVNPWDSVTLKALLISVVIGFLTQIILGLKK